MHSLSSVLQITFIKSRTARTEHTTMKIGSIIHQHLFSTLLWLMYFVQDKVYRYCIYKFFIHYYMHMGKWNLYLRRLWRAHGLSRDPSHAKSSADDLALGRVSYTRRAATLRLSLSTRKFVRYRRVLLPSHETNIRFPGVRERAAVLRAARQTNLASQGSRKCKLRQVSLQVFADKHFDKKGKCLFV